MAIDITLLDKDTENKNKITKNWCDYKGCAFNQQGYCQTGPELIFKGSFNQKGKPEFVCIASCKI